MEILTLGLFCAALLLCIFFDFSLLYALLAGLLLFCVYAFRKGFSPKQIAKMLLKGIGTAKNILIVFVLIGMLTALWRASGTIAVIVSYAARLIRPKTLLVMTFLLNCGVSLLMGTSFGTAATMGVICMTVGRSMGASPVLMGGAILAGAFFGDRCSPVSTSVMLVSELTKTDLYDNIRRMFRTALLPFLLSCAVYTLLGLHMKAGEAGTDLAEIFSRCFTLHPLSLLPAAIILVLSLFRVKVKLSMSVSIISAAVLCLVLEKMSVPALLQLLFRGFSAPDAEVAALLDGGGIFSMLRVMAIICISSSYSGIFRETGLLDGCKGVLQKVSEKSSPFGGVLLTGAVASMLACNQTLAIILTRQLSEELISEKEELALTMEDTVVVIAALVPWSIAGGVPLASIAAPTASLLAACYLYLLPLCGFLRSLRKKRKKG